MSVEFIKKPHGAKHIYKARKQQKQLSYFTRSVVQEEINETYIKNWIERKYQSDDEFLNWVKTIFRTDNFLSFFKYFRSPLASARLVNDVIKPQLSRVFYAEDSYFKYTIKGKNIEEPEELKCEGLNDELFDALLFRYNDIMVVDLESVNKPYREIVSIENVVAIESSKSVIKRIAYTAQAEYDGKKYEGFIYIDAENFIFYNKEYVAIKTIPHDLGVCPADYISGEAFDDCDIVRKSIFSYVREEFEEYVFLKTLQRMSEAGGVIPVVTQLKTKKNIDKGADEKGSTDKEPVFPFTVGGQKSQEFSTDVQGNNSKSLMQPGTIIEVPMIKLEGGGLDMEAVKNFINFFHAPVEPLKYLSERIESVRDSILKTVLGDMADQTNDRKNELQVKGGFVSAEDRIRALSAQLTRLRKRTDYKMLGMAFGVDNFTNDAFYGSDFFLESQETLYILFEKSPNPIERRNILKRLSKNRNRFNRERSEREVLMYELMPYSADVDFEKAIEKGAVDKITFQLQTRFNYWISVFEAQYGDIVLVWKNTNATDSEKLVMLNNFLYGIIKDHITNIVVSDDEKLVNTLNSVSDAKAAILMEQLESEEMRAIMGKTGSKKQPLVVPAKL